MARAADPIRARAAAEAVVRALRRKGHEAYFAGGCVRDELLGLHPTDFDVATDATPPVVRSLFRGTHEVGEAFGVLLVPQDACVIEVATFRAEGAYSDSRRPDSVRFSTPADDAARRDFTINALFLDPLAPAEAGSGAAGRVIDLVGGLADLRAGVLRAVGDPDARLTEDHLRALRAVRFASRLGFEIEPATASAIARHAAELRGVSRERIGQEVRRMLTHPARARAAAIMQQLGLDAAALNEPAPAPADPASPPALPSLASLAPEAAFPVASRRPWPARPAAARARPGCSRPRPRGP
jgi:poly(A) polymerase